VQPRRWCESAASIWIIRDNTSTSSSTDRFQYGYDRNDNVQYRNNLVYTVLSQIFDFELYQGFHGLRLEGSSQSPSKSMPKSRIAHC
jgi:hypothetical protein